jgi:hypothetical protein
MNVTMEDADHQGNVTRKNPRMQVCALALANAGSSGLSARPTPASAGTGGQRIP